MKRTPSTDGSRPARRLSRRSASPPAPCAWPSSGTRPPGRRRAGRAGTPRPRPLLAGGFWGPVVVAHLPTSAGGSRWPPSPSATACTSSRAGWAPGCWRTRPRGWSGAGAHRPRRLHRPQPDVVLRQGDHRRRHRPAAPALEPAGSCPGCPSAARDPFRIEGIVLLEPTTDEGTTMPDLQIYSLEWCPYCIKAKALLKAKEIPYRETDVTYDREQALEMIERSGRNSVPQIFLDDEHVGGYAELAHLTSTGELDQAFGRQPAELKPVYDVAVIGGGAAGLSAAMYASRKGLSTVARLRGRRRPGRRHPGHLQLPRLRVRHRARALRADDRAGGAEPHRAPARRVRDRPQPRGPLQGHRARVGPAGLRRLGHHRQRRDQAPAGDPRRGRVRGLRRRLLLHL